MTRRRWIADEISGNRAALTGEHADHLIRVLRAHIGQEFDIAADGVVRRGRIVGISDQRVEFELGEDIRTENSCNITLFLAVFKFDRMEWAIEKCTELGVSRIVPVIARRTDSHLASSAMKRVERWRRIAAQASEQSRRVTAPELADPIKLKETLSIQSELRIVLSEAEEQTRLLQALGPQPVSEIALATGPEGGWTEDELKMFAQAGWLSASLGSTILRAETAAIAATAVVASHF